MKEVNEIIELINNRVSDALKENLVGIYYHGSLAFGCFNFNISDLDLIIVVKSPIKLHIKKVIIDFFIENGSNFPQKGIEMSVVMEKYAKKFVYPTPYELHYGKAWEERYLNDYTSVCNEDFKVDPDLAAHFTVIRNSDCVVYGKPVKEVFGEVEEKYFIQSFIEDINNAEEDILINDESMMYVTLNLCRSLMYFEEGMICSKLEGGQWALEHADEKYRNVITQAINKYRSIPYDQIEDELKEEFATYMLSRIGEYVVRM